MGKGGKTSERNGLSQTRYYKYHILSLIHGFHRSMKTVKAGLVRGERAIGQGPFTHNGRSPLSLDSVIGPVGADDRV